MNTSGKQFKKWLMRELLISYILYFIIIFLILSQFGLIVLATMEISNFQYQLFSTILRFFFNLTIIYFREILYIRYFCLYYIIKLY